MYWSIFLHFYQPFNQQKDILERIVNESYRPILRGLKKNPKAKMTVNLNGGLIELLDKNGYQDVIRDFKRLAQRKQIELTGSAKYHPFLPLLPEEEIIRQIKLNEGTLKKYFSSAWLASSSTSRSGQKKGFFLPELAYHEKIAKIIHQLGYQWLVAEELALPQKPDFRKIYQIKGMPKLRVLFRDKRISVLILSAIVRSAASLNEELGQEIKKNRYLLTVMDGETFGHHRPGLEKLLLEFYQSKDFKLVTASDLVKKFASKKTIQPRASTWSSEEQDFWLEKEKIHPFNLWSEPRNPIHKLQWEFTYWLIDLIRNLDQRADWFPMVRQKLDRALQSDQYWWASAKPWWSLEMIEQGAFTLKEVIREIPNLKKEKNQAEKYYRQILDLAFDWQRTGKIRQAYRRALKTVHRKPYQERAIWDYNRMILEFEDEMNKAVQKQEFEKAIKWRDAIYKISNKTDIYDVLHVVDDLRAVRHLPSLKSFWEYAPEEFSDFAKKYFINFDEKKFRKIQLQKLWQMIRRSLEEEVKSHPLGLWLKKNEIYLSEFPSQEIKFELNQGWNSCSRLNFPRHGQYHRSGQCLYQYKNLPLAEPCFRPASPRRRRGEQGRRLYSENKDKDVKIVWQENSLLAKVTNWFKEMGSKPRVRVCAESLNWQPVSFQKENRQLVARIPYSLKKNGIKFIINIKTL